MNTVRFTKKRHLRAWHILVVCAALILTPVILELTGITHFLKKTNTDSAVTTSSESTDVKPTNTVDYSPAKPQDNTPAPEKDPKYAENATGSSKLALSIVSTRRSTDGNSYLVKVAVSGATSGTCQATMQKDNISKSSTTDISLLAGQYSCTDLRFPISDLSDGTWQLTVNVSDLNGNSTSSSQQVIL